jgi:hypothetical protein
MKQKQASTDPLKAEPNKGAECHFSVVTRPFLALANLAANFF